jgi:hypothetical protein
MIGPAGTLARIYSHVELSSPLRLGDCSALRTLRTALPSCVRIYSTYVHPGSVVQIGFAICIDIHTDNDHVVCPSVHPGTAKRHVSSRLVSACQIE